MNKYAKLVEETNKELNEGQKTVNDIVSKGEYSFSWGSGTQEKISNVTKKDVMEMVDMIAYDGLFDDDFYSNHLDGGTKEEYTNWWKKNVLAPILKNTDKFFKDFFTFKDGEYQFNDDKAKKVSQSYFVKSTNMPEEVRYAYNEMVWDNDGLKLDPKRYTYVGEWPSREVLRK